MTALCLYYKKRQMECLFGDFRIVNWQNMKKVRLGMRREIAQMTEKQLKI